MSASVATASSKSGRLPPAAQYVDIIGLIKPLGARNDLAKAMVTRAALHQGAGDVSAARELLEHAYAIFQVLGTRDEPARVKAALTALDRGFPIQLLAGGS